jgi:hypothetical protein
LRPETFRAVLASAAVYLAVTLALGRHVLGSLATRIASDAGDPVLNASILAWNATHSPWTDAWYQFPIFFPLANALTLSEHLLGVSLIASPVYWATGSAIAAYNVALLLSYPICGVAMFALVWRLTRSAPAAFLAGLAYAFTPYRASQLPHVQMLTMFWAPLALLGLHTFAATDGGGPGRAMRAAWLAFFAVCWLLQGAANGYMLVYFSVLVGLWALWFLLSSRRWRDAVLVVTGMAVAALPLAPILARYVQTHREFGLTRNLGEIASFGADIAAPLCAPSSLTFWGWLRIACAPEGELFAGVGLIGLCLVAALMRRGQDRPPELESAFAARRSIRGVRLLLLLAAIVYGTIAVSVVVAGPWRIDLGWLRASASGVDKPLSVTVAFLLAAYLLSPAFAAMVRRRSAATFYLIAAVICWVLSWGPFPRLLGTDALYQAPFAWLLQLPGVDGLRVPARFWMMTVLCLCVYAGIGLAERFSRWSRGRTAAVVMVAAIAILIDGWMTIPAAAVPTPFAGAAPLRGQTVISLPLGDFAPDVAALYGAVTGQWRSVNGFSGYEPGYYEAVRTLAQGRSDALFEPFVARGDLFVVVDEHDQAMRAYVERQPRASVVGRMAWGGGRQVMQYRIPRRPISVSPPVVLGERARVFLLTASCSPESLARVLDLDPDTAWLCGPQTVDHFLAVDLGHVVRVGVVVQALGAAAAGFPRHLAIETSVDGTSWEPAWQGSPAAAVLAAAMDQPRLTRVVLPFPPRAARYVRLRQTGREPRTYWSMSELEVWSGPS